MGGSCGGKMFASSEQDIGNLVVDAWVVLNYEIEACEEQSPAKLPLVYCFSSAKVLQVFMICVQM